MLALVIWLICALIVIYIAKAICDALELPGNIRTIVMLIVALVVLLSMFTHLGMLRGPF